MALEVEINGTTDPAARYLTFAPSPCRIRQDPAAGDLAVTLRSRRAQPAGGDVLFFATPTSSSTATLDLTLPANGDPVNFWTAGKWGNPSCDDGDCLLVAESAEGETTVPLMVRVRKNANTLKCRERDRFLEAFKLLNNGGNGVFQDFRDMHVSQSGEEAHRGPHFLPWHRSYLLDLERQLQLIDPAVSLHYWRFDEPAPHLLDPDFIGATEQVPEHFPGTQSGRPVAFRPGHPLAGWVTDGTPGILRTAFFDTQTEAAPGLLTTVDPPFPLIDQTSTLALGSVYGQFRAMEGTPHGAAHVSFGGPISAVPTAAKDPLFFMLHSNVDRLWALWQWIEDRTNPSDPSSYEGSDRDGRRVGDTMWPWNNVTGNLTPQNPRPPFAPRGQFGLTSSPAAMAPGTTPTVGSMVDSQGHQATTSQLGFGYDDVPFENPGGPMP